MIRDTPKILFIGPHRPGRNGSQRFRMEQYFPYLERAGFSCDYSWFLNKNDDRIFYSQGSLIGKAGVFLKAVLKRLGDVLKANRYDIIFVQREAFMTGTAFFEKQFSRSIAKLVFDFDDAIWLEDTSEANKSLTWLKRPSKTADILSVATAVIAGNNYLAVYANQFNKNVTIIPTTVDTDVFLPHDKTENINDPVIIGWIGSMSTIKHLNPLFPMLKKLKDKYGDRICIQAIGGKSSKAHGPWMESIEWSPEKEMELLNGFDIGLMPLPDDEWAKGKCGFKAIQYMSLKIPPVVSPVGMNVEIITDGKNGFFAGAEEEWLAIISRLIESPSLRHQIGEAARQTVVEKYSVSSQLPVLIEVFTKLLDNID